MTEIRVETIGSVLLIELDGPDTRNAVSAEHYERLRAILAEVAAEREVPSRPRRSRRSTSQIPRW